MLDLVDGVNVLPTMELIAPLSRIGSIIELSIKHHVFKCKITHTSIHPTEVIICDLVSDNNNIEDDIFYDLVTARQKLSSKEDKSILSQNVYKA